MDVGVVALIAQIAREVGVSVEESSRDQAS